jgi:hypothetical protein
MLGCQTPGNPIYAVRSHTSYGNEEKPGVVSWMSGTDLEIPTGKFRYPAPGEKYSAPSIFNTFPALGKPNISSHSVECWVAKSNPTYAAVNTEY